MKRRRGEAARRKRLCSATGSTVMKMWVLPMEQCDRNPWLGLCWGGNVREVMSRKPTGPCTGMPAYVCNMCLHTYMCFCVTLGLHSLDYPAISNSCRLLSLDIPWLTCVTTHSQITRSLIHLWGWLGGWEGCGWSATPQIIRHLAFPQWEGGGTVLLLSLSPPLLYVGGAMQPWIRFVALADMWTDSCQQDVLNQSGMQARISPLPLSCPWSACS